MVKALFDTNILIDYFNGVAAARDELAKYEDRAISIVSWIEVLAGLREDAKENAVTRAYLSAFEIIGLDETIAEIAIEIRRTRGSKLPDAIIWASAQRDGRLLVTRDGKDFAKDDPGVRVPYRLD